MTAAVLTTLFSSAMMAWAATPPIQFQPGYELGFGGTVLTCNVGISGASESRLVHARDAMLGSMLGLTPESRFPFVLGEMLHGSWYGEGKLRLDESERRIVSQEVNDRLLHLQYYRNDSPGPLAIVVHAPESDQDEIAAVLKQSPAGSCHVLASDSFPLYSGALFQEASLVQLFKWGALPSRTLEKLSSQMNEATPRFILTGGTWRGSIGALLQTIWHLSPERQSSRTAEVRLLPKWIRSGAGEKISERKNHEELARELFSDLFSGHRVSHRRGSKFFEISNKERLIKIFVD